ncbi:MAG: CBS domain-containing protein [Methanomicrobiaceae archaeon]|nr:CBS domain-containing protein [Methanomicrobiaceae archaeon]
MDLSLIQKDILITLISLYHKQSHAIKGEEIAEVLRRNPGTVRNQMQALKALSLVDGVPGPKGGYTPTEQAYRELNLTSYEQESDVPISKDGKPVHGVNVSEIDFTTICHPDVCHAVVKLIGSVKLFTIGDMISIGPTPVNKLLVSGEIYGKDEVQQALLITISEMISLPKKHIKSYMSSPLYTLPVDASLREAVHLFTLHHIHGAPVIRDDHLLGIVTLSDIARGIDDGKTLETPVSEVMTADVETAPADMKLFEVIGQFKEREIGRLIIVEGSKPVGILTQSDIIRVFPLL